MTLLEITEIWAIKHPSEDFWDGIELHKAISKEHLTDYLMYEFADMQTIDSDSGFFREHVRNFFHIHKWNIDKLGATLEFQYDPLENRRYNTYQIDHDKKDTGFDSDKNRTEEEVGTKDNKTTSDEDSTHDVKTTVEGKGTKNNTTTSEETKEEDWTEEGENSDTKVHFVSAYNDYESPTAEDGYVDTEEWREISNGDYSKQGTDNEHTTGNGTLEENTTDTETTTVDEGSTKGVQGTLDEDTSRNETDHETFHSDEDMNDWQTHDYNKYGHDDQSYQELVLEERRQAEFNLYKWIGKHFCRELLVTIW